MRSCLLLLSVVLIWVCPVAPLPASDALGQLTFGDGSVEYTLDDFAGRSVAIIALCRS